MAMADTETPTSVRADSNTVFKASQDSHPHSRLASLPAGRKSLLLAIFCLSQLLDTFNNSALFAAIPPISLAIGISNANSVWLLSAYQLTFAALLLTVSLSSQLGFAVLSLICV